jgi:translation initiation factor IF-3
VIDEEGNKLGEFMTEDAVRLAEERGMDLVEVSPNSRPPVCRIADFGKLKYEKKKKESVARRNQVQSQLKEVKVRPKTDDHDMGVKTRMIRGFLNEGHKVKITVRFRGRELAHRDIGAEQCHRIAEAVKELSMVESPPRMEGRQMFMILAPTRKPQPKRRPTAADGTPVEEEPLEELHEPDDFTEDEDDEDDDDLDDEEGEEAEEEA